MPGISAASSVLKSCPERFYLDHICKKGIECACRRGILFVSITSPDAASTSSGQHCTLTAGRYRYLFLDSYGAAGSTQWGSQVLAFEQVLSGLSIGLVFGVIMQRGRICFNSAFRDMLLFKDRTIAKTIWIAIVVEMVGFAVLTDAGLLVTYPRGLYWAANPIGGFIFGVGMVLAGGCVSGSTYRAGEGMVGSMLALAGIGLGATITLFLWLAPLNNALQTATEIEFAGGAPTLTSVLGLNHWTIIAPVLLVTVILAWRSLRNTDFRSLSLFGRGWPWWFSGVLLGLVATASYPALEIVGGTYPGFCGGYVGLVTTIAGMDLDYSFHWETALVLGAIIGAALAAAQAREWKLRIPRPRLLVQSLLGGVAMGFGSIIGDGCNIATILIGVPLFSIGSILAGTFTILGCWAAAYIMFR